MFCLISKILFRFEAVAKRLYTYFVLVNQHAGFPRKYFAKNKKTKLKPLVKFLAKQIYEKRQSILTSLRKPSLCFNIKRHLYLPCCLGLTLSLLALLNALKTEN